MINPNTIDAMFDEILELRRKNKETLDRLHVTKRQNREDKVKLRNELWEYKKITGCEWRR